MPLIAETSTQFLARMLVATREDNQITSEDAQRLDDLAQYGPGPVPSTMPEARRSGSVQPRPVGPEGLIRD